MRHAESLRYVHFRRLQSSYESTGFEPVVLNMERP